MRITGVQGPRRIEGLRDEDSHRTYKITYRVEGNTGPGTADGPANALQCPGLPQYGDQWLIDADVDLWAYCRYPVKITPVLDAQPNKFWDLEFTYTTKPDKALCLENQIEDPLLKPPKLSGQSVKYTEEAVQDRFGNFLFNSAWEQFRGPQVEFDKNRHRIHIEMPVPFLNLGFVTPFIDTVNAYPIWGMNRRCVKLSEFKWERNFYGVCFPYYTWMFDFDLNAQTFDRDLVDEATKVLRGHWLFDATAGLRWVLDGNPDPSNPRDFIRAIDYPAGNPIKTLLNGAGEPADVLIGTGTIPTQPVCALCKPSTTPSYYVVQNNASGGPFVGDYSAYQDFVDTGLSVDPLPTDACKFTASIGVVVVKVIIESDSVAETASVYLEFRTTDSSISPAVYSVELQGSYQLDGTQFLTLSRDEGDPNMCPAAISLNPGPPVPDGPTFSGPPGFRHIEKYDESDFALLGIPLIF